jgi:predicted ATPase
MHDASKRGIAMLTFDELCGDRKAQNCSPAGAVDMLAIADKFHTLYLTDMPALALSVHAAANTNPNHARRFVLLLDAMYEKRNRLVISTFAETIEELFAYEPQQQRSSKEEEDATKDDEDVVAYPANLRKSSMAPHAELSMTVTDKGGSSGRLTTMFGGVEWSATGLQNASLALAAGAGKLETAFALERAYSRLKEMQTVEYRSGLS